LDLFQSRKLFTRLIEDIPELASHLAPRADIVESPHFEAAVEKVQGGKERELSTLEKSALRPFLKLMMSSAMRMRLDMQTLYWSLLSVSALSPARSTATSPILRPQTTT